MGFLKKSLLFANLQQHLHIHTYLWSGVSERRLTLAIDFSSHYITLEPRCHTVSIATDSAKYILERIRDRGCALSAHSLAAYGCLVHVYNNNTT